MQIVTPGQMRLIEERSEQLGVSRKKLMENAGRALAGVIDDYCRKEPELPPEEKSIVFIAGKGNNGGDCYAAADILTGRGYKVRVICISEPTVQPAADMYKQTRDRFEIIHVIRSENTAAAVEAAEIDFMTAHGTDNENDPVEDIIERERQCMRRVSSALRCAYVIVDGVFGTGFRGRLDKDIAAVFAVKSGAYRIAADVPSGGDSSTGRASEGTFTADLTVAFGFVKTGMTQYPLKKNCGEIVVADIGLPVRAVDAIDGERQYFSIDRAHLGDFPYVRARDAHKGTFGRVLVIAGSSSMRGAAAFAAMGALRSGAGLVQAASVEKCINTVSVLVPEATFIELECDDYGFMLYDSSVSLLKKAMEKADSIVIGCGMGVTPDTAAITEFVVKNAECPVIIDADGINCISSDIDILLKKQTNIIITPHPGEMAKLLGCTAREINGDRFEAAEKFAEEYAVTVVLKGAGSIIADSSSTAVNHTGNPGMSCGGSGDLLAGMIGSLTAQDCGIFRSCCIGTYLHGLAGDIAAARLGEEAMLPRDTAESIPEAFRLLRKKEDLTGYKYCP